jgi:hypothetical protein
MSRDIDMSDPDAWLDEDIMHLAQRDQLPDDPELQERAQELLSGLSSPTPLDDLPNTGTINSLGLTKEQFERAVELLRMEEAGELEVDGEPPEDTEDEDYDEGWNNDQRRAELLERGLIAKGDKEDLMARLLRSDSETLLAEDYPDGKLPEEE